MRALNVRRCAMCFETETETEVGRFLMAAMNIEPAGPVFDQRNLCVRCAAFVRAKGEVSLHGCPDNFETVSS